MSRKERIYTEGTEGTEFTEKRRKTKRRGAEYAEKNCERQEGHDVSCPYKRREKKIANARKLLYGGKLKDLSLESIQTVTTFVFWLFSGSLGSGMGEKGLMATRISTLVVEPVGDLALTMA